MALTEDEARIVGKLMGKVVRKRRPSKRLSAYYEGVQRLEHIGLAVPPQLRRFETVLNVPRMAVDEVERRLDVRALYLPGEDSPSETLADISAASDMEEQVPILIKDSLLYGCGFASVAGNPDVPDLPLIQAEHAPDMAALWDKRGRYLTAALRVYRNELSQLQAATLYTSEFIILLDRTGGSWVEEYRLPHGLGRVPVVAFPNRPRTGAEFQDGSSEMADVIGLTDAIARTITNMQVAAEAGALPQKYAVGIAPKDFIGKDGKPIPAWQSYFTSVWATANKDAKMGSFTAASLDNFHKSVDALFKWCAAVLGLPLRYAAQETANPAAEGAIRADEARLVKNCERKQAVFGSRLGALYGMAYQASGRGDVDTRRIRVAWHDAATPTYAQRADATQKLTGGIPILSREGAWDELGWTPERMETERRRFEAQESDPIMLEMMGKAPAAAEEASDEA